jgi:hypothetical protein
MRLGLTDPAAAVLAPPLQQLWREHLLAESYLQNRSLVRHDEGIFAASVNSPSSQQDLARRRICRSGARLAWTGKHSASFPPRLQQLTQFIQKDPCNKLELYNDSP